MARLTKNSRLPVVAIMLAVLALFGCDGPPILYSSHYVQWGEIHGGLQAGLVLDHLGDDENKVVAILTIRNPSSTAVEGPDPRGQKWQDWIVAYDAMARATADNQLEQSPKVTPSKYDRKPKIWAPGETWTRTITIDLNRWKHGKWKRLELQFLWNPPGPSGFDLRSPRVKVQISRTSWAQ